MPRCCSCEALSWVRTLFRTLIGLAEIGLAIAVILIVYYQLTDYDVNISAETIENYQCLLGTSSSGDDLCVYAYIVSGIAIGAALFLMISVCFKCTCWLYVDIWLELIVTVLAALVWFVAALVVTDYNNNKVQTETDAQKNYRDSITTIAWVLFAFFCADAVFCTYRFCYKVCGCCGGYEATQLKVVEAQLKERDEELAIARKQLADANIPPHVPGGMEPTVPGAVAVTVIDDKLNPNSKPEVSLPSAQKPAAASSPSAAYPHVPPAGATLPA